MIDMSHDRADRGTWFQIFRFVLFKVYIVNEILVGKLLAVTEFLTDYLDVLDIESLIDGNHHAEIQKRRNNLIRGDLDEISKLGHGNEFVHLDHRL